MPTGSHGNLQATLPRHSHCGDHVIVAKSLNDDIGIAHRHPAISHSAPTRMFVSRIAAPKG